nr:immunoglobulin heavy chain junction region [Macaca mulatta]
CTTGGGPYGIPWNYW